MTIRTRVFAPVLALLALSIAGPAWSQFELNMPVGVTTTSRDVYDLHMLILWVCVIIGAGVYGAMIVAIVKFRKSKGAVAAKWTHNSTVEVIWTVIPAVILVAMAVPAAETLIRMEDTRDSELTIKVTGYQWRWHYDYIDDGVRFFSTLDRESNAARRHDSGIDPNTVDNYLAEGRQRGRRSGQHQGALADHGRRRAARVVGAGVGREERRRAGLHQRILVHGRHGGHVSRPMRRALRHGSRLHADRRPRREPGRLRLVAQLAASRGQLASLAMTFGATGSPPFGDYQGRGTQQGRFGMSSTAIDTHGHHGEHHSHGFLAWCLRWLTTTNHKEIGTLYLVWSLADAVRRRRHGDADPRSSCSSPACSSCSRSSSTR